MFCSRERGSVSTDPGLSHPRTTKAGLLGGKQDQLLIELHAVETAGQGREEGNAVI